MQLRFAKAHQEIPLEGPEIWGVPFNIFATAEASNFKFGAQLGFAKAHHKGTPRGKSESGGGIELGELPKIFRFSFNIFETAEASDFKFGIWVCQEPS